MSSNFSRRSFLKAGGAVSLVLLGVGCSKSKTLSCNDTAGMPEADVAPRTNFAYVEPTPDTTKACSACQQFVAPSTEGQCGGCKIIKGPISPNGTCKVWTPKA